MKNKSGTMGAESKQFRGLPHELGWLVLYKKRAWIPEGINVCYGNDSVRYGRMNAPIKNIHFSGMCLIMMLMTRSFHNTAFLCHASSHFGSREEEGMRAREGTRSRKSRKGRPSPDDQLSVLRCSEVPLHPRQTISSQ